MQPESPGTMIAPSTAEHWQVVLTVVDGPHAGMSFAFDQHDTFVVGRGAEAHFCLPEKDPYVSRYHFLVEVNPPLCRLVDMGSHNGTRVNGEKVSSAILKPGDRITAGVTSFRVELRTGAGQTMDLPVGTEEVLELQQADWQQGRRRTVAEYLAKFPGLADRKEALLEVIVEEILLRRRAGETPDLAEYRRRFPALAKALDLALMANLNEDSTELPPDTGPSGFPAVPGYRIEEEVGKGGMGVVYRAIHLEDGQEVAIKTIAPAVARGRVAVERFLREAKILENLRHPHIVGFRAMAEANGLLCFVMDFVHGVNGNQLHVTQRPLSIQRAVNLGSQMLEGLAYAHAQGFVHRDIKPGNLLISQCDGKDWLRIADFGLARAYQDSPLSGLTLAGTSGGTPPFMPPEQILDFRSAKPATDQYAAAATMYYLLTGHTPFGECTSPQELFKRVLQQEPRPIHQFRPDVPESLAAALHRAMARGPSNRFSSLAEFRQALAGFEI